MKQSTSKRRLFLAILLMLSAVNYSRIKGTEDIRWIEFLSIFSMGILFGLLVREVIMAIKNQ